MKIYKITVVILFSLIALQLAGQNLNEGFETEEAPPQGWIMRYANENPPEGNLMIHDDTFAHQGDRSFRFSSFVGGAPYDQYLITPRLETSEDDRTISFYYRKHTLGNETFRVGWSTTGTDLDDFQWSENITNSTTEWQQFVKNDLPIGESIYFCIHYLSVFDYYLYIDTVVGPEVYTPEEPPEPARIVYPENRAIDIPLNPTLEWRAGDNFTMAYNVYFGTELPDEPNSREQRGTTFNPGELENGTTYYWKIEPLNDFGATEDPPVWSFTTLPAGVWTEYFEGEQFPPEGWREQAIVGDTEWRRASGGHSNNPAGAAVGEYNALFYGGADRGHAAYLVTPVYDATEVDTPMLTFWHAQGDWAGDLDTLKVYYSEVDEDDRWELIEEFDDDIPEWTHRQYLLPDDLETIYIKFEVVSDFGWGVVLDGIQLREAPAFMPPADLRAINIRHDRADLTWEEVGDADRWDIELGLTGFEPTGEPTVDNTPHNPYTMTELDPSTSYDFYVRANGGDGEYSDWTGPRTFATTQITANLPFNEDFTGEIHWTFLNGEAPNQWHVGNATALEGVSSAYISNDGGDSNEYTITTSSTVHLYRDIYFDEDATSSFELSFHWKGMGEGDWADFDYMRVFLVGTDVMPQAGEQLVEGQLGETYNMEEEWQEEAFLLPNDYAGRTLRLVFTWRNDSSLGTQPPVAIDDISVIELPDDIPPRNLTVTDITHQSAVLGWDELGAAELWDIELGETGFEPTGNPTRANLEDNPYRYDELDENTTYDFYVRSNYGNNEFSDWAGPQTFSTRITPAYVPFVEDFEGELQLELANDNQTNQWHHGFEAAYQGDRGLYISDTDGRDHQYDITASSVVHAYRDIFFPEIDDNDYNLSFWWKGMGENNFDYLRVFLVDPDIEPTAGIQLTTGQLGGNLQMQENWTQENFELSAEDYAGTTKKLVFSWRNDASIGEQPPAALDNIMITMDGIEAPQVTIEIVDDQIRLSWEDLGYASSYRILAADDPFAPLDRWEEIDTVTEAEYTEDVGEKRFYRVIAVVGGRDDERRRTRTERTR